LLIKDLNIVQNVAESSGLSLHATNLIMDYFKGIQAEHGRSGTQALKIACSKNSVV